jgi:hypothetical protein
LKVSSFALKDGIYLVLNGNPEDFFSFVLDIALWLIDKLQNRDFGKILRFNSFLSVTFDLFVEVRVDFSQDLTVFLDFMLHIVLLIQ